MSETKKQVAILISGRGSNMMSLIAAAREPDYPAEIACVCRTGPRRRACSRRPARACRRAPSITRASARAKASKRSSTRRCARIDVDIVACAGFMRLMTPAFVERWRDRMLNIHPSLLPAFKGLDTHARALAAGVKLTGCTVHVVRPEVDSGPIIAQAAVPVLDGDTAETWRPGCWRPSTCSIPTHFLFLPPGQ